MVITETGPNNADLNRPLITEDLPQPLQIIVTVGHKTTTEITVVIIAVPHKIGKKPFKSSTYYPDFKIFLFFLSLKTQPSRVKSQQNNNNNRAQNSNSKSSGGGGGRCPGGALEMCIDVCPSFSARIFGACVSGCAKRCPAKK